MCYSLFHLDSLFAEFSSIWLVLSFVIDLVWHGCHSYTALCLKFIACGSVDVLLHDGIFLHVGVPWHPYDFCLTKLALTRIMWAYNIMGKYL